MPEPRKRGRPPAPNPRRNVSIYLTDAELAEIDARRARLGQDRASYLRHLLLTGLHDRDQKAFEYHESGQAAIDEAAEIDEEMAELGREIARLNPPVTAPGTPAEREEHDGND